MEEKCHFGAETISRATTFPMTESERPVLLITRARLTLEPSLGSNEVSAEVSLLKLGLVD